MNVSLRRTLGLAIAVATLTAAPFIAPAAPWNIKAPTLGGSQFWTDVRLYGDWRIQRNVLTGHYRLLDADNVRQAWGSLDHCCKTLDEFKFTRPLPPLKNTAVIILHGLGRRRGSMDTLADALKENDDWTVMCMSYASTREDIAAHAAALHDIIENLDGVETVHLVGHSLGNIVIRHYVADRRNEPSTKHVGCVVMLGPPNNGAAMARLLDDSKIYEWILGPAGVELGEAWDKLETHLATPACCGIIAGSTNNGAGTNPMIPGDDDLIVGVDETRLDGAADFLLVPAFHTTIMNNRDVIEAVKFFLQNGRFPEPPTLQPADAPESAND